jgi:signal transduction histidine kinase
MRIRHILGRKFSRPTTIWCLFTLMLVCIAIGLMSLSQHALRLSRDQQAIQQRETLQQDTLVALWRLDSRLGPFLATLHDPITNLTGDESNSTFVRLRFRIQGLESESKGPQQHEFAPLNFSVEHDEEQLLANLTDAISANAVVDAVNQLLPGTDPPNQASLPAYTNEVNLYASNLQDGLQIPGTLQSQIDANLPSGGRELLNRNIAVQQQFALNYSDGRSSQNPASPDESALNDPESQFSQWTAPEKRLMTVWVDDQLFVIRSGQDWPNELEGVWIDWQQLEKSLASDIFDLIPDAKFLPVTKEDTLNPAVTLAALPARLVAPSTFQSVEFWSPTHNALLIAWFTLLAAALIAAISLRNLINLSERRATFVSAVTHELRTPLTTFRLYTDLLARDMVSDPADRQEYLETLRQESDRLTHLIDNVLRYSKLERISSNLAKEVIVLGDWIDRISPRLAGRLKQCDMTLVIDPAPQGPWKTDPPAMEQVVFNLIDNAAKYAKSAADQRVHLSATIVGQEIVLIVSDHGPGVPHSLQRKIFQPFSKSAEQAAETAAGVGLGLALARQTATAHGGTLSYQPTLGGGATFVLSIPTGVSGDSPA